MRTRTILASLGMALAGAALCLAADVTLGTWKLNEAKSKFGPGAPKNTTVVYASAGDSVKITVDGVDKDGKPAHNEWTGKWDGKDYPVTGDPSSDSRAYTRVDDHTLTFNAKKAGKVTVNGKVSVSADGKTRTVTVTGTDAAGKATESTAVYDRQ
jgi:hypothetical protein